LHVRGIRVIHVMSAVTTAKGDYDMSTLIPELQTTQQPAGAAQGPKPRTKGRAKPRQKANAKKGANARKRAATGARQGSKTAKVLDLLKRSGGATLHDLIKATSWQAHSVRGFLSGTLRKKMGLALTSTKGEDGARSYALKS